ncbi:hypothetical protein HDV03_000280 [Kappamyces sp. JEL0829]|nr:hypothetical protein HDV03_000280 [Kappamyces sp. JEL0829]
MIRVSVTGLSVNTTHIPEEIRVTSPSPTDRSPIPSSVEASPTDSYSPTSSRKVSLQDSIASDRLSVVSDKKPISHAESSSASTGSHFKAGSHPGKWLGSQELLKGNAKQPNESARERLRRLAQKTIAVKKELQPKDIGFAAIVQETIKNGTVVAVPRTRRASIRPADSARRGSVMSQTSEGQRSTPPPSSLGVGFNGHSRRSSNASIAPSTARRPSNVGNPDFQSLPAGGSNKPTSDSETGHAAAAGSRRRTATLTRTKTMKTKSGPDDDNTPSDLDGQKNRRKKTGSSKSQKAILEDTDSRSSTSTLSSVAREIVVEPVYIVQELSEPELIAKFMSKFASLDAQLRQTVLLQIIKECNPGDMRFLNEKLPMFHRDFLTTLDRKLVYRILEFVTPQDIVTCAFVSKAWHELTNSKELWYALYGAMGLASMAKVFHIENGTQRDNAKRYYSISNWAHGIFSYRNFQAHHLGILCMSFDGKTIATGSSDKSCKLFLVKNGILLRTLEGHDESIQAVQHDEEKIVTGSADSTIKVWANKDAGACLATLTQHTLPVTCLRLIGSLLVSGSEDKTVRIWDLAEFSKHKGDGKTEPSLRRKKRLEMEEMQAHEVVHHSAKSYCLRTLHGHESAVKSIDFHEDIIVSGDIRGYIIVWHKGSGNSLNVFGFNPAVGIDEETDCQRTAHDSILKEPIAEIQFSGNRLLVATLSGYTFLNEVLSLPTRDSNILQDYTNHLKWATNPSTFRQHPVYNMRETVRNLDNKGMMGKWSLCCKSDEWRLMSGGSQGYLIVYNHRIGKYIYKLKTEHHQTAAERTGLGKGLLHHSASHLTKSERIRIGSFQEMAQKLKSDSSTRTLTGLAFDDSHICAVGTDGRVHVWEPHGK